MPISFRCLKCPTILQAAESASGQAVRCPKCQTTMRVPAKAPPPPAPGGSRSSTAILPSRPPAPPAPAPVAPKPPGPSRWTAIVVAASAAGLLLVCSGIGLTGAWLFVRNPSTTAKDERAEAPAAAAKAPKDAVLPPADDPAPAPGRPEGEPGKPARRDADADDGDLPRLPPLPDELPAATVPLFIAQVHSLDRLLAEARLLAAALGKKQEFEEGLTNFQKSISEEGTQAVDPAKPWGCYARVGDDGRAWAVVALVPIRGEAPFRRLLRDLKFQDQGAAGELVPFKAPQAPSLPGMSPVAVQHSGLVYVRFARDYAHVCLAGDPNLLAGDRLLDPSPMFVRRDKLLSLTLRLDRLPSAWRQPLLAQIQAARMMASQAGDPAARPWAARVAEFLGGHAEDLVTQGRNLSLDLGVDAATDGLAADLYLQGADGSRLSADIASLAETPSVFGAWPPGDAAFAARVNVRLPAELRAALPALIEAATRQTLRDVGDPKEREKHEKLFRTVGETFAAGELDGAVVLRGRGAGQPALALGGVKVPNGAELDQRFREAVGDLDDKEFRAIIELDAERSGELRMHRFNAQKQYPADLRAVFADHPMYMAFHPRAVLWGAGPNVKQALSQALQAPPKASPLLMVMGDVRRLNQLTPLQPGDAALAEGVFDARHPGRFRLELSGGNALRLHVGLDVAILRYLSTRLARVPLNVGGPP